MHHVEMLVLTGIDYYLLPVFQNIPQNSIYLALTISHSYDTTVSYNNTLKIERYLLPLLEDTQLNKCTITHFLLSKLWVHKVWGRHRKSCIAFANGRLGGAKQGKCILEYCFYLFHSGGTCNNEYIDLFFCLLKRVF